MREKGDQKMMVAIMAYEHPDLVNTLLACREAADDPEDIMFCVGIRYEDIPNFKVVENYFKIKNDITDYPNTKEPGEVEVQYAIFDRLDNEDYILQISPGVRMASGWDTKLKNDIEELSRHGDYVISGYPGKKAYTKWSLDNSLEFFSLSTSKEYNDFIFENRMVNSKYYLNYFVSSDFIFAKAEYAKSNVFPNYHKSAWKEEELSLVTYCAGYDVVSPYKPEEYAQNLYINTTKRRPDDVDKMKNFVVKLLIRGKHGLFDITNLKRSIEDFYKEVGLANVHRSLKAEMDQWIYDSANDVRNQINSPI